MLQLLNYVVRLRYKLFRWHGNTFRHLPSREKRKLWNSVSQLQRISKANVERPGLRSRGSVIRRGGT